MALSAPDFYKMPISAPAPSLCSVAAGQYFIDPAYPGSSLEAVPEGAVVVGCTPQTSGGRSVSSRASAYTWGGDKSNMARVCNRLPVKHGTIEFVGVASDAVAANRAKGTTTGVYVYGACNARCESDDYKNFGVNQLVFVMKNKESFLYAGSEKCAKDDPKNVVGILGTVMAPSDLARPNNGYGAAPDRTSSTVRVWVTNHFDGLVRLATQVNSL